METEMECTKQKLPNSTIWHSTIIMRAKYIAEYTHESNM